MRLAATIAAAWLVYATATAGTIGHIIGQLDATLLQRVAAALH
jgi:hypothetical protein